MTLAIEPGPAIIGIAIGVPVALALFIAGVFFIRMRRKSPSPPAAYASTSRRSLPDAAPRAPPNVAPNAAAFPASDASKGAHV